MNFLSKPKKFKKYFKNKTNRNFLFSKLITSDYGLQSKININLQPKHFLLLIKILKRCLKGFSKKNTFWIRKFPDNGVTKKPKEIRMGRGKGTVAMKVAILYKGQILIEIKNLNNILMFYIGYTIKMKFPFLKMTYIKW